MRWPVPLLLALALGCGRVGFDAPRTGAGDDVPGGGDAAIPADAYRPPTCSPTCGVNRYCATPAGMCGAAGTCVVTPSMCTGLSDPVCGCDGTTYDTACLAEQAGVSVATVGPCPSSSYVPNCSPACGAGDYCYTPVGACGTPGSCRTIPPVGQMTCTDVPVCGCDLQTYGNGCVAAEAGMSLSATGFCGQI